MEQAPKLSHIPKNLSLEAFLAHPEVFEPNFEQSTMDGMLALMLEEQFPLEVTPPSIIAEQLDGRLPTDEEQNSFRVRICSEEFLASRETLKAVLLHRIQRFIHVLRATKEALKAKEIG